MANGTPAPGWAVEHQIETTDLDPSGRAVAGIRVSFVTSHGIHQSVFVSKAAYSEANVRSLIQAAVAKIDAIQNLSG